MKTISGYKIRATLDGEDIALYGFVRMIRCEDYYIVSKKDFSKLCKTIRIRQEWSGEMFRCEVLGEDRIVSDLPT